MILLGRQSWEKGRADGASGAPEKCPEGLDELAYASGYIEGEAERITPRLHVLTSSKANGLS
jgi:hypothetical protein